MDSHAPADYRCPFCRFARGEVMLRNAPEDIVYADDALLAFIAPRTWPRNAGNVLIVPRAHYENLYAMPDDLLASVMVLAKRIAIAMKSAYGCDGTSLRQHNEPAGNQDVWHFHLHVFPRWEGDRLYQRTDEWREVDAEERQMYAARMRTALAGGDQKETHTMDDATSPCADPDLCSTVRYGPVEAVFVPSNQMPPLHLIGNVNIVPFVGVDAVVLRVAGGRPEIPGGTLEPGEDSIAALHRELREEAGAALRTWSLLGAYRCHSASIEPYRPHLPHPDFFRVVGYGEIELVTQPTNPPGGEEIIEVNVMPVEAAKQVFREWQRPDIAALFHLAATCRQSTRKQW